MGNFIHATSSPDTDHAGQRNCETGKVAQASGSSGLTLISHLMKARAIEVPIRVVAVRKKMKVSEFYMTALLKAMGRSGVRMIKLSVVVKWLDEHPTWKSTQQLSQPEAQSK